MKDIGYMILGGIGLVIVLPCVWLGYWCHCAIKKLKRWEKLINHEDTKEQ